VNHTTDPEKKAKEAADLRGQAKAYTLMGAAGAAAWAALELLPLLECPISVAVQKDMAPARKFGILAAFVGIGAAAIALERHLRASTIDEEKQELKSASVTQTSWASRVAGENRTGKQSLDTISR